MKAIDRFKIYFKEELYPLFIELDKKRNHLYRKRKYIFPTILLLIFSFISIFAVPVSEELIGIRFLFFLIFSASIFILIDCSKIPLKEKKAYIIYYKNEIVEKVLNFINPLFIYKPTKYISVNDFKKSLLNLGMYTSYGGDDYVSGTIGKTDFWGCELKLSTEMGNNRYESFQGIFFIADFNKDFSTPVQILPKGKAKPAKIFSKKNIVKDFENPLFEKYYTVYCKDPITARYIITPSFMKRLIKLDARTIGRMSVSFVGTRIYVAIPTYRDLFEPPLEKPQRGYFYKAWEILVYMNLCVNIVKTLDLNTRIWTKE